MHFSSYIAVSLGVAKSILAHLVSVRPYATSENKIRVLYVKVRCTAEIETSFVFSDIPNNT